MSLIHVFHLFLENVGTLRVHEPVSVDAQALGIFILCGSSNGEHQTPTKFILIDL